MVHTVYCMLSFLFIIIVLFVFLQKTTSEFLQGLHNTEDKSICFMFFFPLHLQLGEPKKKGAA